MNNDPSLASHVNTVVAILGIVFTLLLAAIGFIVIRIWKNIDRLSGRIDEFFKLHYECQKNLPLQYLCRDEFREFKREWHEFLERRSKDWESWWNAFNGHRHDKQTGLVIRRDNHGNS